MYSLRIPLIKLSFALLTLPFLTTVILSIVGALIGIATPITIVQMLWLNMIMDTFSGIAFSYEPP